MSSDRRRNARAALHQLGQMSPSLQSVVRTYIEHLEIELPRQKIKVMQLRGALKRLADELKASDPMHKSGTFSTDAYKQARDTLEDTK